MQRLISSFTTALFLSIPTTVQAQHQFGGGFYQPNHNNWQQNQSGGDTVVHDGRVLTNNLAPNTDTCNWVRGQGLSCQYERWDDRTRTHFVRSIPNNSWGHNRHSNPGWNNNSGWHNQPWNGGGGGCLFKQWNKNGGFQVGNC